ncbi:HNH endonuclease [Calothrix sp. NIES-2100]|uniref:HNH endonuclease n=1 Tax=Calothrix sp. NIES-2100 TaxID=1954172 RepID=UPI000BBBD415
MRLFSHADTPVVRHIKVKGEASPYNGDLVYWSSRMGAHPEMPKKVATLLKQQKGKCTHCGLYFRTEDLLEVDHIIPRSKGGKDEYKNLQVLHKHCHDTKTAKDGLAGGMHLDKHQIIEEPDEGKSSRPVLKTSRSGDGAA